MTNMKQITGSLLKSRKANMMTVIFLIILLVVIIILLMITGVFNVIMSHSSAIKQCSISFLSAATLKMDNVAASGSLVHITCPRTKVTITASDVYKKYQYNDEAMKRIIAEQFRECWYKTGEGKVNPFGRTLFLANTNCVVCSEISLSSNLLNRMNDDGVTPELKDLYDYITFTVMGPGEYGDPKLTYGQYVTTTRKANDEDGGPESFMRYSPFEKKYADEKTVIRLDKPFVLVYTYERESRLSCLGDIICIADDFNTLDIISLDEINNLECEKLHN